MAGDYDVGLVALSVFIAMIAAYSALDLAAKVPAAQGRVWPWMLSGAVSLGIAIWSMHFIGMLAFRLPIPTAYDAGLTLLSLVIAVAASGVAFVLMRLREVTRSGLGIGAIVIGVGIASMHYTGMLAMRMSPPIRYAPWLALGSVLLATGASLMALLLALQLRHTRYGAVVSAKLASAALLGLAISGMHYMGMAAAEFAPGSVCLAAGSALAIDPHVLAIIVGAATLLILLGTLVISSLHAHLASSNHQMAESLRLANERLKGAALHDSLTGLPNRMLLHDRLELAQRHADRSGKSCALLFIDLDGFKPVNDTHGHRIGDLLLKQVGQRLLDGVRKDDTVARIGGDEFVVILNDLSARSEAAAIAQKILGALQAGFRVESISLQLSASIGISAYPEDGSDILTLVAKADQAMYRIKREGGGGVGFDAPSRAAPGAP